MQDGSWELLRHKEGFGGGWGRVGVGRSKEEEEEEEKEMSEMQVGEDGEIIA